MALRDTWDGLKETARGYIADRIVGAEALVKARARADGDKGAAASQVPPEDTPEEILALMADPFALVETLGYRERYSPLSYDVLNRMAYYVPIYPTILQTRRNQVASFCAPQTDLSLPGFRIGHRDRKRRAGKKDQVRYQAMEEWMTHTGSSRELTRDTFDNAIRKLVRDSMVSDQMCFEKQRNKKGVICNWYPVDGQSMRVADTAWKGGPKSDDDVQYVQVHDETVIAEFTPNQLCFAVRNPRSDLRVNGYGESELEIGIKIATALINGWHYNSKFFENGTVAKGMLNIPRITGKKLRIFSRQWHMMTTGMVQAWRTPITNFEDPKWIDLDKSRKDMEWAEFINFCIKLFSGICLMDPTELHFQFGNTGQTSQMFQAPAEEKIKYSKDKGLRPLLAFLASQFNRHLIWQIDPDMCFYFTGLDPRDSQQAVETEKKLVSFRKTVNQMRAENDDEPLPPEEGDIILDATWMQNHMALRQETLQREQMQQDREMSEADAEAEPEEPPAKPNGKGKVDAAMAQAEDAAQKSIDDEPIGGQTTWEIEY